MPKGSRSWPCPSQTQDGPWTLPGSIHAFNRTSALKGKRLRIARIYAWRKTDKKGSISGFTCHTTLRKLWAGRSNAPRMRETQAQPSPFIFLRNAPVGSSAHHRSKTLKGSPVISDCLVTLFCDKAKPASDSAHTFMLLRHTHTQRDRLGQGRLGKGLSAIYARDQTWIASKLRSLACTR